MWKVLQNTYNKQIAFGAAKDTDGELAKALGIESATGKESYVLVWEKGASEPSVYSGQYLHKSQAGLEHLLKNSISQDN